MNGPSQDEVGEWVLKNVQVMRTFGIVKEYDIIFTDRGVLFAMVASALKVGARDGLAAGIGGGTHGLLAGIAYAIPRSNDKARSQYQGMELQQVLDADRNNFYISYLSIDSVTLRKKLMGRGHMSIQTSEGKVQCEFPKEGLGVVKDIVSERMSSRLTN